ncbi:MAG TPA: VWA domain-containing protein [Pyrinomonadaceae bacterium]|nr:VWA domain-containing protein [Pyrinomonadaceae bacterium]
MVDRVLISRLFRVGLALLFVSLSSASILGQAKPTATPPAAQDDQEIDPSDVISVDTTEILLPVTVRDRTGRLVSNLTRKDFRIFEDGVEQPLSDLRLRQVPVDVALIVDASSSVSENLDDFRTAIEGFATHLAGEDRVSLIQFDDKVMLLQDWTRSLVQLRRALRRIVPGMFTRFHDAMLLASRDQAPRADARHAIIVLTDGIDSGRGSSFEAALRAALQSQTTVYVISNTQIERAKKEAQLEELTKGSDSAVRFNQIRIDDLRLGLQALDVSERHLEELTRVTGGRLYKPTSFGDLERTYAEVAEELRKQYTLYYSPLNSKRDGQFRRVTVETSDPANQVSARVGYYAPKK